MKNVSHVQVPLSSSMRNLYSPLYSLDDVKAAHNYQVPVRCACIHIYICMLPVRFAFWGAGRRAECVSCVDIRMCMCLMCMYTYACVYIRMYVYRYTYARVYTYACVWIYVCVCVYIRMCGYIYTYACVYIYVCYACSYTMFVALHLYVM